MRRKRASRIRRKRKKEYLLPKLSKILCSVGCMWALQIPSFIQAAPINQDQQSQVSVGQFQKAENMKKSNQHQGSSVAQGQLQTGRNDNDSTSMNQVQFASATAYEVQTGTSTGPASMDQRQSISLSQQQTQTSPHISEQQRIEVDTSQGQTMRVSHPSHMIQADITNVMSIQYQGVSENGAARQQDMTQTHAFQFQVAAPNN